MHDSRLFATALDGLRRTLRSGKIPTQTKGWMAEAPVKLPGLAFAQAVAGGIKKGPRFDGDGLRVPDVNRGVDAGVQNAPVERGVVGHQELRAVDEIPQVRPHFSEARAVPDIVPGQAMNGRVDELFPRRTATVYLPLRAPSQP